jgi:glutamine synthetase
VAKRHGLECLLHEKPFKHLHGSGKHNNWSIVTNTGKNLLNPGKNPNENLEFLLFITAVIKAVDEHATLLRYSASNPGNDHRLGGHEAPPAIISIFLGEQLEDIVRQIIETGEAKDCKQKVYMNIGVHTLPEIRKDATDRNRTSPFAFTGNKFEFRMLGSSMSVAGPNTVLNTIVADTLSQFSDELEQVPAEEFETALKQLLQRELTAHERIIFNGDGYSEEWTKEAERRGYGKSMFERLLNCNVKRTTLKEQYRMHPSISKLINSLFYDNMLIDKTSNKDTEISIFPNKKCPFVFICHR